MYYVCAAQKADKTVCSGHTLRDSALLEITLELVKKHIQDVINLSDLMDMTDTALLQQANTQRLRSRVEQKHAEIDRLQTILCSLYESLTDGIINRDEYHEMKKTYTRRRAEAEKQAEAIQEEIDRELTGSTERQEWIEQFRKHQNITSLDRTIVVALIERIMVYREHNVEIIFRWQSEFQWLMEMASKPQDSFPSSKAV